MGISREDEDIRSPTVDPAALAASAVAAAITLATGEGRYDFLDLGIGVALLFLLAAYYRPLRSRVEGNDAIAKSLSFGAIAGLLASLVFSPVIQGVVGTPQTCMDARRYPEASDVAECAGAAADPWVLWTWLICGAALFLLHLRRWTAWRLPPLP